MGQSPQENLKPLQIGVTAETLGASPSAVEDLRPELHLFITPGNRRRYAAAYIAALAGSEEWRQREGTQSEAAALFAGSVAAREAIVISEEAHEAEVLAALREREDQLLTARPLSRLLHLPYGRVPTMRGSGLIPRGTRRGIYVCNTADELRSLYAWQRPTSSDPTIPIGPARIVTPQMPERHRPEASL
jgi:hypothetical protein